MVELHTCLWNEIDAFNFRREDFNPLMEAIPYLNLHFHDNTDSFLQQFGNAT